MSDELKPGISTEAWFKELENRLDRVCAFLGDAEIQTARSLQNNADIRRHLSLVQELIARIEDRAATLFAKTASDRATVHPAGPEGSDDYREVLGFPGYRVSSDGRIWGSRRAGRGYGRTRDWRALKPYLVRPGPAPMVSLYRDRVRHSFRVSAVVLAAFVGPCPKGFTVGHTNGNLLDTRLENLRYVLESRA